MIYRGSGPPPPLNNHKNIGLLWLFSNTGPDSLKNHKATMPAFNVGPSSAGQRNVIEFYLIFILTYAVTFGMFFYYFILYLIETPYDTFANRVGLIQKLLLEMPDQGLLCFLMEI